jgi:hypothetical protein
VELDAVAQPELEQIERLGGADLVIGILNGEAAMSGRGAISLAREALAEFSTPLRVVVVCDGATQDPSGGAALPEDNQTLIVTSCNLPPASPGQTPQQGVSNAYRSVFNICSKLSARACGLIASHPQEATPQWIYRLVQPVVNLGFDLVAPCYTRRKMEGLLNRSVLAPLHRALYGERLENPLGPDFGISGKLLQQILRQDSARRRGADGSSLASIASAAASGGFQVCESHLGVRRQRTTDWGNLSSLLADVLGAMFLEMEARAALWQSIRGSRELPRFGTLEPAPPDTPPAPTLDVHGMLESFQLGAKNLQDIWGAILPPATLLELRRMSRLSQDQFRFPDQVWARTVYDFALGHRLRTINRDHLLRSFTPLYLGWIASYAQEMQTAGVTEADLRIERVAKAFEDNKSYLVSRWRWPDRFNP